MLPVNCCSLFTCASLASPLAGAERCFHVSRLYVLSCVRSLVAACECVCLTPRAPNSHHLCNARPWLRQGLGCVDELLARPRADPRVRLRTLTHALLPQRAPSHVVRGLSLRARVWTRSCLCSASASGGALPPKLLVTTLRSCRRCVWLCTS